MKIEPRIPLGGQRACVIVYGDHPGGGIPISAFAEIERLVPTDAVLDPHLARIIGAAIVAGPPDDLALLRAEVEAAQLHAMATADRMFKHKGADATLSAEAKGWLAVGEQGRSSKALFAVATGVTPEGMSSSEAKAVPLDVADFRRCARLYETVPEVRTHLARAANLGPVWHRLVDRWDELMALYRAQDHKGLDRIIGEVHEKTCL